MSCGDSRRELLIAGASGTQSGTTLHMCSSRTGARDGQKEFDEAVQALFDVLQVFHIGRLSIVDAQCFEAMGEAWLNIAKAGKDLTGVDDETPHADRLRKSAKAFVPLVNGLNHDVYELVVKGKLRLSPAQSLFNRLTHAQASKELDEKYFPPTSDAAATGARSAASPQQNLRQLKPTTTPNAVTRLFVAQSTPFRDTNAQLRVRGQSVQTFVRRQLTGLRRISRRCRAPLRRHS